MKQHPILIITSLLLLTAHAAATGQHPLISLMAERLGWMQDVAAYKYIHQQPIEDPEREADIIQSIGTQAVQYNLDPLTAQRFFRAQIEAAKAIQTECFERWRTSGEMPKSEHSLQTIRQELDNLTHRLMQQLSQLKLPAELQQLFDTAAIEYLQEKTGASAKAVKMAMP